MKIVLDASAAISLVLEKSFHESLLDTIKEAERVIAPNLYCAEVGSSLWKYRSLELVDLTEMLKRYQQAISYIDEFFSIEKLTPAALRRAHQLNHSIYDMYYLVLADAYDAHLVTMDKRLVKLAQEQGIRHMEFWHYRMNNEVLELS